MAGEVNNGRCPCGASGILVRDCGIIPTFRTLVPVPARNSSKALPRLQYGAHSLRAGFVTEALECGVNEIAIARQTGHASLDTLRLYMRSRDPFKGNAAALVGL